MALPDRIHLELECILTEAELRQASKGLAETHYKRAVIKDGLDQAKAKVKAELAVLDAQESRLSGMVRTERETRDVLCEVTYDFKAGQKTFVRVDTGEIARVDKISMAERQKEI